MQLPHETSTLGSVLLICLALSLLLLCNLGDALAAIRFQVCRVGLHLG